MPKKAEVKSFTVLGSQVSVLNYPLTLQLVEQQLRSQRPAAYICVAAVHLIMAAYKNPRLQKLVNQAFLVTPDGMPLVCLGKMAGYQTISRVYGPTLTWKICQLAQKQKYKIFLLGGASGQGQQLAGKLQQRFPRLLISGHYDTPQRPLTKKQNQQVLEQIKKAQADVVLLGLGCPYQEEWMAAHSPQLPQQVLIGVGAAFDFISGRVAQAPTWIQNSGLEWLFRLIQEPQRLWRRYLLLNSQFIFLISKEVVQQIYKKLTSRYV